MHDFSGCFGLSCKEQELSLRYLLWLPVTPSLSTTTTGRIYNHDSYIQLDLGLQYFVFDNASEAKYIVPDAMLKSMPEI